MAEVTSDKVIHKAPVVKADTYLRYPVDILLPFHGQYQRVFQLCKAIWRTLGLRFKYQICLIDDHSPNGHFIRGFVKAPRTLCIRNDSQLGFGGALEEGFKNTQSPWVVTMHSDVLPENHLWLSGLIDSFNALQHSKVAMVSARSDKPGEGFSSLLKGDKDMVDKDVVIKEGSLPLYCAFFPRKLFSKIGGFIKAYPYALYEDEELAYRMKKYGYAQGVSGVSWVKHEEGATIAEVCRNNPQIKDAMEANRDRCIADMQK